MDYLIKFFEIAYSILVMSFIWMALLYVGYKVVKYLNSKLESDNDVITERYDRDKH